MVLFLLFLAGYIVSVLFREQALPVSFIDTIRTLYITLVGATVVWTFWLWSRLPFVDRLRQGTAVFFSMLFTMVLGALVITEWFGYHRLAVFAFKGLFLTVIYTTILAAVWRLIEVIYHWVDNKQYALARKVHQLFGVKFNKKLHEFTIIKFAMHLTVLSLYVIAILKSWDIAENFVGGLIDGLLQGFKFLGFTIIPSRLVLSLISFAAILLFGRFLATSIAQKQHLKGEEDTQIAISTITIYISFAVALLFALLVTGVDFTGLAIIAGALSVGVGLGLQTIVNNFVSGLILLIEKPIKPGDRIVIGKTEGFVRKIRIRSTQIATLAKEDVIVPNADLITQQVTNYMFRDRNSRVTCSVCVAYGSDVDLVKKLLFDVAEKHGDVVHEAPNEPTVLFSSFGENGLHFNLWCVIHDVNKKYRVISELNFAIDAEFRKHNVVMAFPQTDIHIKDYTVVK
jgi:small-conductance mechanosensitive channel